ncbi:hypothetical protein ACIHDR_48250 [Nocardia sp. NPDC052278]|uniref:hypothetical protein n=1 Tax=unclassified Nocardia TaxID=2637762 RepID=UPI0036779E58
MGAAIPLGEKVGYALAEKILTELATYARLEATDDPRWLPQAERYKQRLKDLKPTHREAIHAILTHDAAVHQKLLGPR